MSGADVVLPFLVAASAVAYAIYAGRAEASRLRTLHADVSNGTMRGLLAIAIVIAMVLASFVF